MNTKLRKYLNPKNYIIAIFFIINRNILHHIDLMFAPDHKEQFPYPPIFIIGSPRSGSTLLFQVLTDAFDLAYLSNFHCTLFGAPAIAERLLKYLGKRKTQSNYKSLYGTTSGWLQPSECGQWWYRFFRQKPAHVTLNDIDQKKILNFRKSLIALTNAAEKPVILKNLYASIRLEPISNYIPEALFIVIKRDEFFNAVSILAGRKKYLGRYDLWWSVPPPDIEELKQKLPCEQVIGQIRGIYREINRAITSGFVDLNRVFHIEYEELCRDTHSLLKQIEEFFFQHGIILRRRFEVPSSFPINKTISIDNDLAIKLKNLLN